jgi:hypothetical protein
MEFCPTEWRANVRRICFSWRGRLLAAGAIFIVTSLPVCAQDTLQESIQSLQKQTSELKAMIEEMKTEMIRSRTETMALRQELEVTRQQLTAAVSKPQADETAVQKLEEEQQLLSAKIDEQYQTKVESASKYRVRLSGFVLMNLFSNSGAVDNIDFPSVAGLYNAQYSRGSFGGTLRQSQFGIQAFGPEIKGARVSGDIQLDLAGGFPVTPDGSTFGLPRLRTGTIRLAWPRTTIVAGQDAPFFSPLSPTSIASLALPEFAYSGNLWTWIPQARIERRVDLNESSSVLIQGGILDPLSGEVPSSQFLRTPGAGEASRQPAYATRSAWSRNVYGQTLTAGIGAYYSRQAWGPYKNVDAWAGTADWTIPAGRRWEISGEFYRGRAIGGLGGGIGRSVGYSGPIADRSTQIKGLNSIGGWSQAKFRQTERLEWNGGFGEDTIYARDLSQFPVLLQGYLDPSVARNQSAFGNFIYRPRSDLVFSLEYRYLRTFAINGSSQNADHVNFGMGVLF